MTARSFVAPLSAVFISAFLTVAVSEPAQGATLPVVIRVTGDYSQNTLTITGQNFGSSPTVHAGLDDVSNDELVEQSDRAGFSEQRSSFWPRCLVANAARQ